jgi:hypothetical protein
MEYIVADLQLVYEMRAGSIRNLTELGELFGRW